MTEKLFPELFRDGGDVVSSGQNSFFKTADCLLILAAALIRGSIGGPGVPEIRYPGQARLFL